MRLRPIISAGAGIALTSLLVAIPASAKSAAPATPPRSTIGFTQLSGFEVVVFKQLYGPLNVTAPAASVYAKGYEHTSAGWKLIAKRQIGAPGQYLWYSTDTCTLSVTQIKPIAEYSYSASVSLLYDPAIGCLPAKTATWPAP